MVIKQSRAVQRATRNLFQNSALEKIEPVVRAFSVAPHFNEKDSTNNHHLYSTLHELQVDSCQKFAQNPFFGTYKKESDKFHWMTYEDFGALVDKTRSLLKKTGAGEYSKIGIISNNRWEWAAISSASFSLNATVVPMYEAQRPSDWTYILNDSQCSTLVCATNEIFQKVHREVLKSTPSVEACLCLDHDDRIDESDLFGKVLDEVDSDVEIIRPTSDDLATLIYTSGTTGRPKGVELTHHNMAFNVQAGFDKLIEMYSEAEYVNERSLAFLPWAHSYGQTCELWGMMSQGASIGICRGIPHILEDLQLVQPSLLFSVPTLYKKVYDGVHAMLEDPSTTPLRRGLIRKALQLGRMKNTSGLSMMESIQFGILNRMVLSKIRARFGGKLKSGFVAGAACPAEVMHFMDDIGITVCEGYGLTETSPIIALSGPDLRKIGSVGQCLHGVRVHVMKTDGSDEEAAPGEEGEICCVGPNVMRGYHNNQEATDEVISVAPDSKSRMFHTGDLGALDENGWLYVTGRIKEQYKLENGKYVVPTPIEDAIAMSQYIDQVVLYGVNRPHNIALLVLNEQAVANELKTSNWTRDQLQHMIDAEIAAQCSRFKKYEVPNAWAIVDPFTVENGMMTPKMSIRRHQVVKTYQEVIKVLYGDETDEEAFVATVS